MRNICINTDWKFKTGQFNLMEELTGQSTSICVNLPHDYIIGTQPHPDAPSAAATGYYSGTVGCYYKYIDIPADWENEQVYLHFDGVMMNATIEINGSKVALHHYGYTPFWVDITNYVTFGQKNRVCVTCVPTMEPNSRWYTGAGIYRNVELVHVPKVHIAPDGIYGYTKEIEYENGVPVRAFVHTEITVSNNTDQPRIVCVEAKLKKEDTNHTVITRSARIQVNAHSTATAIIPITVPSPVLWDCDHPQLYSLCASATDLGVFTTMLVPAEESTVDETSVIFGIRTIQTDSTHGIRINGKSLKLKGGCLHHDNGLLGAASIYDAEYRKIKKLKDQGFNLVRCAHNPPSSAFLDACDRLGMYVFNEAFDAWGIGKQPGDYNQFFASDWKDDIRAYMLRDRSRASVIFWSTGNEIFERGGLNNGYQLALELAAYTKSLDASRPVTNGFCSYWSGLDDATLAEQLRKQAEAMQQNAPVQLQDSFMEDRSEPFVSMLDVVGYNYLDSHYEIDGERYPERVILGTESFPMNIDIVWDKVEKLPFVIGDCTWTAFDYIGEAGIGQSKFFEPDDPILNNRRMAVYSMGNAYPWRLGNDADFDINGNLMPQGVYRSIVWGSTETGLFVQDPANYGKEELISMWGWPAVTANWNWNVPEGAMVRVVVYSSAPEVELLLNGTSMGRRSAGKENRYTATFDIPYAPGTLEAISMNGSDVISSSKITTTGKPAHIRLSLEPETGELLRYVQVDIVDDHGEIVPNAQVPFTAVVEGDAFLAGFGSSNPITEDNYTTGKALSYHGKALAILRVKPDGENAKLIITSPDFQDAEIIISMQ